MPQLAKTIEAGRQVLFKLYSQSISEVMIISFRANTSTVRARVLAPYFSTENILYLDLTNELHDIPSFINSSGVMRSEALSDSTTTVASCLFILSNTGMYDSKAADETARMSRPPITGPRCDPL